MPRPRARNRAARGISWCDGLSLKSGVSAALNREFGHGYQARRAPLGRRVLGRSLYPAQRKWNQRPEHERDCRAASDRARVERDCAIRKHRASQDQRRQHDKKPQRRMFAWRGHNRGADLGSRCLTGAAIGSMIVRSGFGADLFSDSSSGRVGRRQGTMSRAPIPLAAANIIPPHDRALGLTQGYPRRMAAPDTVTGTAWGGSSHPVARAT